MEKQESRVQVASSPSTFSSRNPIARSFLCPWSEIGTALQGYSSPHNLVKIEADHVPAFDAEKSPVR